MVVGVKFNGMQLSKFYKFYQLTDLDIVHKTRKFHFKKCARDTHRLTALFPGLLR